MSNLLLNDEEVQAVAGGLTQPRRQLAALHESGFWRARLGTDGRVILERAHYEAVCVGATPPNNQAYTAAKQRPALQPIK